MRFSDSVKWTTNGAKGAYDYRSVATHEFGHAIGLGDLHDNPNLTMYYAVKEGSTSARRSGSATSRAARPVSVAATAARPSPVWSRRCPWSGATANSASLRRRSARPNGAGLPRSS